MHFYNGVILEKQNIKYDCSAAILRWVT